MIKEVCDICKENQPDKRFKIKMSRRGVYLRTGYGSKFDAQLWQPYERISICNECAEKVLGIPHMTTEKILKLMQGKKENNT